MFAGTVTTRRVLESVLAGRNWSTLPCAQYLHATWTAHYLERAHPNFAGYASRTAKFSSALEAPDAALAWIPVVEFSYSICAGLMPSPLQEICGFAALYVAFGKLLAAFKSLQTTWNSGSFFGELPAVHPPEQDVLRSADTGVRFCWELED